MRKITLLALLVIAFTNIIAQDNSTRLQLIDIDIEAAVKNQDYDKAAKLKKEKVYLIEIDKAVAAKNYEKAAELKKELNELKEEGSIVEKKEKTSFDSPILKNGFFIDGTFGGKIKTNQTIALLSIGMKMGNKWYFGNGKVYRPGIQTIWVKPNLLANISSESVLLQLAVANIGFASIFAFSENIGLEVNANIGYGSLLSFTPEFSSVHGLNTTYEVKFRYKKLALGIDLTNAYYFYNNYSYSSSSLGVLPLTTGAISIGKKF